MNKKKLYIAPFIAIFLIASNSPSTPIKHLTGLATTLYSSAHRYLYQPPTESPQMIKITSHEPDSTVSEDKKVVNLGIQTVSPEQPAIEQKQEKDIFTQLPEPSADAKKVYAILNLLDTETINDELSAEIQAKLIDVFTADEFKKSYKYDHKDIAIMCAETASIIRLYTQTPEAVRELTLKRLQKNRISLDLAPKTTPTSEDRWQAISCLMLERDNKKSILYEKSASNYAFHNAYFSKKRLYDDLFVDCNVDEGLKKIRSKVLNDFLSSESKKEQYSILQEAIAALLRFPIENAYGPSDDLKYFAQAYIYDDHYHKLKTEIYLNETGGRR